MSEDTSLDTAIPSIGWRDTTRETEPQAGRRRAPKKTPKKKKTDARPDGSTSPPAEGTGTTIDVTV